MATVGLPLTGAGDATAQVAVDVINGEAFQRVKLFDATEGSTVPITAKATTPGAADGGMVVRPIGSTAFNQAVVGSVGLTSGSSAVELTSAGSTRLVGRVDINNATTALDANLTSVGSTKLVGKVDVNNPTTAVSLSSQHTFTLGNPTTAVEANLSTVGSTRLVGRVDVNNPTTAVSLSSVHTVTVGNPTTAVTVSSGVILGAGSSANMLGQVQATGTTKVDVSSGLILGAGSSANVLGSVTLSSVTTAITVGSVALLPGASTVGSVQQGAGSSANFWYTQPLAFSSANAARTTVNTSADIAVIAANAARKALVIANLSTAQIVGLGMSTGAVTTGLTNVNLFLPPNSQLTFGYSGGLPLFTGPFRGINISSTAIAGGVAVIEFT